MVVAAQPEATETAVEILRAGGNAVDAAVACAFAQGVIDPLMCGIAGFGSCGMLLPGAGVHEYVDFHAPAPLASRPDMWEHLIEGETRDGFGFLLRDSVNELGYQSICTPAALRAYWDIHHAYGRLPWQQVVEPAISFAEEGWTVRPQVASFWARHDPMGRLANDHKLRYSAAGRALYCRQDGTPKQLGDEVVNRDLGATLRAIAEHGVSVFYEGEIAHAMTDDIGRHGGLLTAADLQRWRPTRRAPLWGAYRGYRVATNQPPGGGVMLLQMLHVLERFDLKALEHNSPEYIQTVAEAMKLATIDKDRYVGDPAFVDVPLDRLTAAAYAAELAERIRAGERAEVPRLDTDPAPSPDTTHLSIVDADGNCVTMTHSLGSPSGVITDGLGFMYNGCMAVFDPRPGRTGSVAPGKARFSAMAPSMVLDGDRPHLVVGAPGGTQIVMGILQTLLNAIDFDMTMVEAVSAPRFSATSSAIDVSNRIPRCTERDLRAAGHSVVRSPVTFDFARVLAIRIHPDGLDGGADPAGDGAVMAV
ncbi:MAG: gamma-glutamyltransferase [Streptosporangiales bacterium]|nr:gamma-glutamyltransferase [Streptosporangiales bacterium]